MELRAVIVDDEPLARRRLKRMLKTVAGLEVIAECGDGATAICAVREQSPDILLLDIQMPNVNGFDVLRALRADGDRIPVTIFVTAFDRYALEAFEAQALDYLLKPFGEERVQQALERARTFLEGGERRNFQERLTRLLQSTSGLLRADCLLIKGNDRVIVLRPREIDWIEADGDYVRFHVGQESHLHRATMLEMQERLKSAPFVRIHRSRLVNFDRIKEFKPAFKGESIVVLKNGTRLIASQSCLKNLHDRLKREK